MVVSCWNVEAQIELLVELRLCHLQAETTPAMGIRHALRPDDAAKLMHN